MTLRFTIADGLNHPPIFLFSYILPFKSNQKYIHARKKKSLFSFLSPYTLLILICMSPN